MNVIQCTRGQQGKHLYFTGTVRVGELEQFVRFPEDLPELDEDQQMQRAVAKRRIPELIQYLEQPDHFFSAVTLVILPRELDRPAIAADPDDPEGEWDYSFRPVDGLPMPGKSRLGLLYLSGDVIGFPADGQHRLRGEFDGMKNDPELAREELPVVMIPFESFEQVRQLFSDLNKSAKVVSQTIAHDFSSRDPWALLAKEMFDRVPLFEGRVNRRTNSLPKTSANVITLNTIVSGCKNIVSGLAPTNGYDPSEFVADPATVAVDVAEVWNVIVSCFAGQWQTVFSEEPQAAGNLREKFVFPHGLGWQALTKAAGELIKKDPDNWESRFRSAIKSLNWRKEAADMQGTAVIHDPAKGTYRVNNTGPAINQLAELIVSHA